MYNLKEIIDYLLYKNKLNINDLNCDEISYEINIGEVTDLILIKFYHKDKSSFTYTDSIINSINKYDYLTYIRTKKLKNIYK